ncbi:uncharacterized protein LOC110675177 [Aedes aegypti]|uniref:Uncharacterized protein n=1 Tax=Aedes aegypti TaxID=7159 RepID=A0A6I8U1J3_AEDAE|nr:uncharacterized protein LOC110675177 [Aedes aegypti]
MPLTRNARNKPAAGSAGVAANLNASCDASAGIEEDNIRTEDAISMPSGTTEQDGETPSRKTAVGEINAPQLSGTIPKPPRKSPSPGVSEMINKLNTANLNVDHIQLRRSKRHYHCSLCDERDNSRMVQCDSCDSWYHFTCAKVTETVAEVDWSCPFCGVSNRTNTLHLGVVPSSNQGNDNRHPMVQQQQQDSKGQAQPGPVDDIASVRSVSTRSKASSNRSRTRRAMELQLLKLEEDRALQQRYLDRKFAILQAYDSDGEEDEVGSIVDKVSQVEDWIQRTDNIGKTVPGLTFRETTGQPPNKDISSSK